MSLIRSLANKQLRNVWVIIIAVIIAATHSFADERLPDYDGSGSNNSRETAINLGSLNPPPGQLGLSIVRHGELGVVYRNKFDTVDFYRFDVPSENMVATLTLIERPDTTQWIIVHREGDEVPVCQERSNPFETCAFSLLSGTYFIEVRTRRETANGRSLTYDLGIDIQKILIPNPGGLSCSGATEVGKLSPKKNFVGSFSPGNPNSHHFIGWFEYSSAVSYVSFGEVHLRPLLNLIDTSNNKYIPIPSDNFSSVIIDPGYYCLVINDAANYEYYNYNLDFFVSVISHDFSKQISPLKSVAVGNLTENGQYGRGKYPPPNNPPSAPIESGREYIIREWVGVSQNSHVFSFSIEEMCRIKLIISNTISPVTAEIWSIDGKFIGLAKPNGATFNGRIPSSELITLMQAGQYVLKLTHIGNSTVGTNYRVSIIGHYL